MLTGVDLEPNPVAMTIQMVHFNMFLFCSQMCTDENWVFGQFTHSSAPRVIQLQRHSTHGKCLSTEIICYHCVLGEMKSWLLNLICSSAEVEAGDSQFFTN